MIVDVGRRKKEILEARQKEAKENAIKARRVATIASLVCPRCCLSQMKDNNPDSPYDNIIADCSCGMRYCDKPDRFVFKCLLGTNHLVWEPQQRRCLYGSYNELMDERGTVLPLLPYTTTTELLAKWLVLV